MSAGTVPWRGRTLGGAWLVRPGIWLLRAFGLRGSLIGSLPVAAALLLIDGPARAATIDYWRRMRPAADGAERWGLALRHWSSYGRVLCDRLLAYSDPRLEVVFDGPDADRLHTAVADGGCLLLSAHVGNWELAGRMLSRLPSRGAHVVMIPGEDPAVQRLAAELLGDRLPAVIDPRDGLAAGFAVRAAIERREVVCLLGDRVAPDQPAERVPFIAGEARFPAGPLRLAAACGAPVLGCFLLKQDRYRYRLRVTPPMRLPRRPSPRAVAAWARLLERIARTAPFQWHNFYPFWKTA